VTPMAGVKAKVGEGVHVQYEAGTNVDAAVALAKASDNAIVSVGNNPNQNNSWNRVNDNSEEYKGHDRVYITPWQRPGGPGQSRPRRQSQVRCRPQIQLPLPVDEI